jgi:hypothetical protein
MVGVTSWLDAEIPQIGYIIWPIVGGSVVLWALIMGGRADRLRLVGLTVAAIGAPMAISVALANTFGFITQGRYLLPLLVGVVLLAAFQLDQNLSREHARTLLRLVALALIPIQLLALFFAMRRWQLGVGPWWNLLHSNWQPVLGPVVPLVAALAGACLLLWLVWRADTGSFGLPELRQWLRAFVFGKGERTATTSTGADPTTDADPTMSPTPATR